MAAYSGHRPQTAPSRVDRMEALEQKIADADRAADRKFGYLVPHPATWKNYQSCPWAKSILAIDPETNGPILCAVTCKRWGCPFCAAKKIRKLAYLTNGAEPNRWIRLGVQPENYDSPRAAWEHTSPQLPEVCRQLRVGPPAREVEYLRVTELHQSGYPHYHALLRSSYIPQKELSDRWAKLTGAPVVWIAKIDATFSSFRYLVKYLTKLHKIEWTDRHVSYSKNFFRAEDREKMAFPERTITERSDEHPWLYLSRRFPGETIAVDDRGVYHLPYSFCGIPADIGRRELDLPPLPDQEEENADVPRPTQLKAFNTAEDYHTGGF